MTRPAASRPIIPVLLSGGSGSRLWPMSRELYPKQFLALASDRSMLRDTAERVRDPLRFAAPIVVCNHEHRFLIAEQLRQSGIAPKAIALEPAARNTAPACAVAALLAARDVPDALLLVLPADHVIGDAAAFADAVAKAAAAAAEGRLVTFGISPAGPETGYGYIRQGAPLPGCDGVYEVAAFIEKPARDKAERMLAEGGYAWNSGMFVFPVDLLLAELERHTPAVLDAARRAVEEGETDLDFLRLDEAAFAAAPSISIDYGVMERTDRAAVAPCAIDWTDVGAWSALWEVAAKDGDGNALFGDVIVEGARGSYVRADDGRLTALVGLDDVVVVTTADAVLVAAKDKAQDVKAVVERLKRDGRPEPVTHRTVHRPWGQFQGIHAGERFQVKHLRIKPGARISLQKHHHRAEHWVVVNGTALVTRGDEEIYVYENQSVHIPVGTVHRLENPGKVPLDIIEVQSGAYLGEDDIVRFEDSYGRR